MKKFAKKMFGFTLIEMILVLVIISGLLIMFIGYTQQKGEEYRRDRAAMQYQQILNAALAFYLNFSRWPATMNDLTSGYLGNIPTNPWGSAYTFSAPNNVDGTFSVCSVISGVAAGTTSYGTTVDASAPFTANMIAGRLPTATVYDNGGSPTPPTNGNCPNPTDLSTTPRPRCTGNTCVLVSSVNIPGQSLSNARSINFAGLYHHGACIPVPRCPNVGTHTMTPQIFVTPSAISGLTYGTTDPTSVYPINSFTAYARGGTGFGITPPDCISNVRASCTLPSGAPTNVDYWRVCSDVVTEKGHITTTGNSEWVEDVATLLVITRCEPSGEETLSSEFTVFERD